MELLIITGTSGSGKHTAFKILEDFGFFCVDNLPAGLVEKLVELALETPKTMERLAIGIDIRGKEDPAEISENIKSLRIHYPFLKLLFLDAGEECLMHRYKESRRLHPLTDIAGTLEKAIKLEKDKIKPLKDGADYVIDTTGLLTKDLTGLLYRIFMQKSEYKNINVTLMSFGYKYGIPEESDYVFDARFLPNPYYDDLLRPFTGKDRQISEFVLDNEEAHIFIDKTIELLKFLIPEFIKAGKSRVCISIGCTGGHHRSVAVAEEIYKKLENDLSYGLGIIHRDIEK